MPEARRVGLVLISLEDLTEALQLMKYGEIKKISTDRYSEGGRVFIGGDWARGGSPPNGSLIKDAGEIGRAVMIPPGLTVIEAFTPPSRIETSRGTWDARRGRLIGAL